VQRPWIVTKLLAKFKPVEECQEVSEWAESKRGVDEAVQECTEEDESQARTDFQKACQAHGIGPAQAWTEARAETDVRPLHALEVALLESLDRSSTSPVFAKGSGAGG